MKSINKILFSVLFFSAVSIFSFASNDLTGLDKIMKNEVGLPFKTVYAHIRKENRIADDGSTLAAAEKVKKGLVMTVDKAPSQFLDDNGQLKSEFQKQFSLYQEGIKQMIFEMDKLISIIKAKDLPAAQAQLAVITKAQKTAHDDFKEE